MSNTSPPAVGGLQRRRLADLDAAEMGAVEAAQELVVVAGHVDDAGALARLAQQLLNHVVVGLRPVPGRAQPPAVDDVADEVDGLRLAFAQELQQRVGLRAARAEMQVRDEQAAVAPGPGWFARIAGLSRRHAQPLNRRP